MAGNHHHHQMILSAMVGTSTNYNHERFITIYDQEMWPLLIGRSSDYSLVGMGVAIVAIVVSATHAFVLTCTLRTCFVSPWTFVVCFVLSLSWLVTVCGLLCWLWRDRAVWHQANPITKGTRWALVIFYDVHEKDKEAKEASS
jgi:hypothetical protein